MRIGLIALAILGLMSGRAAADDYPSRNIKVIIPFASGGVTDVVARIVFNQLSEDIGQHAVLENRTGASGTIGFEMVARAPADGYTLLVADPSGSLAASVSLYPKLNLDPAHRLTPVALLGTTGAVITVSPKLPAKTIQEFVALAKSHPGELHFASAGAGTPGHLDGELFNRLAGIDTVHVPYVSMSQAITDLIGGRVDFWIAPTPTVLPHIQAGSMRALAVGGEKRAADLPDVPTVQESGLGEYDVSSNYGVLAPAGTPPEIVNFLYQKIMRTLATDSVQTRLRGVGVEPRPATPQQVGDMLTSRVAQWGAVIREAHISLEGR
jgi:tripartite-type tricarboxylate transporter receptor subunit TctC